MDIELSLRQLQGLENPGPRFADGVMSRVGDVPVAPARDGVLRLADARLRKRSRRILIGTLAVVAAAAASMLTLVQRSGNDAPVVQDAVAALPDAPAPVDAAPVLPVDPQPVAASDEPAPQACVDPDVLRGLLLPLPDASYDMGTRLPPELAAFKAPRPLEWVGSSQRKLSQAPQVTVAAVYRSRLSREAARVAVDGALIAGGWKLQPGNRLLGSNVFVSEIPGLGDTYCREGRPVGVTTSALDGVVYVVLSIDRNAGAGFSNTCAQPPMPAMQSGTALDKYMPKLELPRDPASGQPVVMHGMSGGGGGDLKRRMHVAFTLKDTTDAVARHFGRQMAAQGWNADTSWSGAGTAGSTWTRPGDDDALLQATLVVWGFDDNRFSVVMQVVVTK